MPARQLGIDSAVYTEPHPQHLAFAIMHSVMLRKGKGYSPEYIPLAVSYNLLNIPGYKATH